MYKCLCIKNKKYKIYKVYIRGKMRHWEVPEVLWIKILNVCSVIGRARPAGSLPRSRRPAASSSCRSAPGPTSRGCIDPSASLSSHSCGCSSSGGSPEHRRHSVSLTVRVNFMVELYILYIKLKNDSGDRLLTFDTRVVYDIYLPSLSRCLSLYIHGLSPVLSPCCCLAGSVV